MRQARSTRAPRLAARAAMALGSLLFAGTAMAQVMASTQVTGFAQVTDPGPRGGAPAAGGPIGGLNADQTNFFFAARAVFSEIDNVPAGLGPRFNMDGCAGCHAQPAAGGSSPATNPQVAVATKAGASNALPPFISLGGPVREARFIKNPDGSADGGVHDLFVITGRTDAPGCNIAQPNFFQQLIKNNVIFRIPTPTFGAGLIENTPDASLVADAAALASARVAAGVSGHFNHSGNDGTVTRFGWKAQNKSLLVFAGEAYNVEQGVTNENFPNEREDDPNCQFNALPEDHTNYSGKSPASNSQASDYSSDIVNQAGFMRFLAAPTPATATSSTTRGRQVFNNIGCNLCHIANHTTHSSALASGLNDSTYSPFSDVELHSMGGLADGVSQGQADGNDFRSAPLWGVGQRLFFLHDGRTSNLVKAIEQHAGFGSEANNVINSFNQLSPSDQQNVVNFLRSL